MFKEIILGIKQHLLSDVPFSFAQSWQRDPVRVRIADDDKVSGIIGGAQLRSWLRQELFRGKVEAARDVSEFGYRRAGHSLSGCRS
jgi:hypothetical protein